MNTPCNQIQEMIIDQLLGELDPQQIQTVQQHLDSCSVCQSYYERLRNQEKELEQMGTHITHNLEEKQNKAIEAIEKLPKAHHRPLFKYAAAIIIIGALTLIYQFTGSIDFSSVVLADVARTIEQTTNCVFQKTTTVFSKENGKSTHNSVVYYTKDALREDIYENEKVEKQVYVKFHEGIILGIDHQMKAYQERDLADEDVEQWAPIAPENIAKLILSKGEYKKLSRKRVDGILSDGFEFNDKRTLLSMDKENVNDITMRLWVDVNTNLPVCIEADATYNNVRVKMVQNKPKWNVALESDFFEPKIPDSYLNSEQRGLVGINLENWPTLKVVPEMAAEKAGVKDGDIAIEVNGSDISHVTSPTDASDLFFGKAGDKVVLTVKRGEERITFEIVREALSK